jgi:hypothetical protein
MPAPYRAVALSAAVVLAGGIVVAVTAPGSSRTEPRARPQADAQSIVSATPRTTPSLQLTHSPTPSPKATAVPSAATPLFPLPAGPAYPSPCPPPPIPPGPPFKAPKPAVPAAALPTVVPVAHHRHVDIGAVTGKGMWLTTWPDTRVNVSSVVTRATAAGLHQIWVRTGGTFEGWYGAKLLTRLLPVAHAAGLKVIAWDFPSLGDPLLDVNRADQVLRGRFGGQRVDGFSPDIETITEGTFNSARRVRIYLSRVRNDAGAMPVIATVLRPTPAMLASYPYRAEAPYVDVFAPMVYWSCTEPGAATLDAIKPLAKLRPVHVIGQSFDMGSMGGRHGLPTGREIWRFLDVAKRNGAVGASLYLYEQTRRPQWRALTRYPWTARH